MRPEEIFPYSEFRTGQKELAEAVSVACRSGQRLVAEAMSGFGKTAAVLAGTISAACDEELDVVYACRTKRQVFRVLEELRSFLEKAPLAATSLLSKYDYCLLRQNGFGVSPETFKWYCSFQTTNNLCSYFLNFPFNQEKASELSEEETRNPRPITHLLEKSKRLHICPYEVARLSVARSRIIVSTYHYLLDGNSRQLLIPDRKSTRLNSSHRL